MTFDRRTAHVTVAFTECNAIVFFSFSFYFLVFISAVVSALASLSVNYCYAVLAYCGK